MKFSFSVLRELRDDMLQFKTLQKELPLIESPHESVYCDVVKSAG